MPTDSKSPEHILVIKLGALGDVIQALGPLRAIRDYHADSHITVLTTAPYEPMIRATGYAHEVWIDEHPQWYQPGKWLDLMRRVRSVPFDRVYDLQTSDRSSRYFRLFKANRKPYWSGIADGCSHPHANPDRDSMHTIERQAEQLAMAGIPETPPPSLDWACDLDCPPIPDQPFGLLVPGGAPHRPAKRWPPTRYADLASHLVTRGVTPVLLGTRTEQAILETISSKCSGAVNLCGQTSILDMIALAGKADVAIGNDTGPMHLIAVSGCASIVLYSHDSDPKLCAQRGANVSILREPNLNDLSTDQVIRALPDFGSASA